MHLMARLLRKRSRVRGQSLVEFALTLPILVLIVFGTVDLGRAFFQSIVLENAVKEGAFLGARTPECVTDSDPACVDPNNVEARVMAELDDIDFGTLTTKCFSAGTVDFSGAGKPFADCEDGDIFYVHGTSPFSTLVPLVGAIVGDTIMIQSEASSVVVSSFSVPGGSVVPIPTTQPTPATNPGMCTVPDFTLGPTRIRDAATVWVDVGGFNATFLTTNGQNNDRITWQSVPAFTQGPCTTQEITVSATALSPAPTPSPTPTAAPTPTPDPSSSPAPTPSVSGTPTPTPAALCTVPNLIGDAVTVAQGEWSAAGFNAARFSAARPPSNDYRVATQSIQAGSRRDCLTTSLRVDH